MPLADTSSEYWPRTWQAALGSRTTLISPTFLPHNGVLSIVRDIKVAYTFFELAEFSIVAYMHVSL